MCRIDKKEVPSAKNKPNTAEKSITAAPPAVKQTKSTSSSSASTAAYTAMTKERMTRGRARRDERVDRLDATGLARIRTGCRDPLLHEARR
ncbi:hypothetical protein [Streptomyces subrutilus]|uniref:hypothetical protein n=1 Tax=Streptomyces subrutilus TaxID=36818 RepID=UPI0033C49581